MASFIYAPAMKSKGGADLSSEVTTAPFQKHWEVIAFEHGVKSPRDAASGLATGRRQHLPVVLTMELGRLFPLLHQMVFTNDTIDKIELKFFSPRQIGTMASAAGKMVHVYSMILSNATVCDVRTTLRNIKNPDNTKYEACQDVSLTYQKIESIWKEGNITGVDDWQNQV
jgi:type VI secretion system secreted protein Hcp